MCIVATHALHKQMLKMKLETAETGWGMKRDGGGRETLREVYVPKISSNGINR